MTLIVHGVGCSWWDVKSKAAATPAGLPVCPYCGGPLFEAEEAEWLSAAKAHGEEADHPEYFPFLIWLQGRSCIPTNKPGGLQELEADFHRDLRDPGGITA